MLTYLIVEATQESQQVLYQVIDALVKKKGKTICLVSRRYRSLIFGARRGALPLRGLDYGATAKAVAFQRETSLILENIKIKNSHEQLI